MIAGGEGGDVPATIGNARNLAALALDHGFSLIAQINDLGDDAPAFVAEFLDALMSAPREKWRPLLVMASGAARVDTDVLARHLGATTISKANPKLVLTATGQVIGGVAPTGHPIQLRTVVDETLAGYPVVWTAAGTADSVMPLTYPQLLALTGGVALPVR